MRSPTLATIQVGKLTVAVEVSGNGPETVLFVHGLGANRGCWRRAADYFDLDRFRLVMPDLPGGGDSVRPDDYDYSMTSFGELLAQVVEELGGARWHVVAHSMGCTAALSMLALHKTLPRSFVAAEGNLTATDAFLSSKVSRLSEEAFVRGYKKWLNMVQASLGKRSNEQHDWFVESLQNASPVAIHRASVSCAALTQSGTLLQQFTRLACPTAYICGTESRQQRQLPDFSGLPDVARFDIAGEGHFMMNAAQEFYPWIARWLPKGDASLPAQSP